MKQTTDCLIAVALVSCLFTVSVTVAGPSQTTLPTTVSARTEIAKSAENNTAVARTSSSKGIDTPVISPTKDAKKQDKKTIGRCWNRIMAVVREARQAHRSQK